MSTWVALLRGVNVGGHRRVPMAPLREALAAAGFTGVRTHLQSGNAVVSSDGTAEEVAERVRAAVLASSGHDVPVLVRTPAQLRVLLAWCPFPDAAERPTAVHVLHLDAEPESARVEALLAADWEDDALVVRGREVVIRYGDSMQTSRLQHALVLRRLGVDGTARNWRTLTALVDLAGGGDLAG